MYTHKKVTMFDDEQDAFLASAIEKTNLKPGEVIREAFDRVMKENPRQFIASLANTQLKMELQKINDQEAELRERKAALQKQFNATREKVPA